MKNIILICCLVLLSSCGYTSIYKNQKTQDFQINIIQMTGDKELNNLIKNEIGLYSNLSSNIKYDISIDSKYKKIIISKNSSGVATDFKILAKTKVKFSLNNEIKNFEFNEKINIKNNTNSFEQNKYERNIKGNFASSIREKILIKIFNLNDN